MFRKTRRRIVATIMGALVLLLAVTLAAIVWSEYRDNERRNADMLDRYVELYSLDALPGEGSSAPPGLPAQGVSEGGPSYKLTAFYSVAFSEQDAVIAVDTGWSGLYGERELVDAARAVLATGRPSGRQGALTYRVEQRDGYTLVAFVDATKASEGLSSLTRHALVAGAVAIVALFFIAQAVARRIVKPLEENDRRQRRFVSDAGHELKTPVSTISANVDLLAKQVGGNEWLDNIRHENGRMGELVTRLLDLSRAECVQAPPQEVDLSRLVAGEVLPFEGAAFERGLVIESDIEEGIVVRGNRLQLAQLASILLDNAVAHAEGGEVLVRLDSRGRHAVLVVQNRGRELTPEQLANLFERFYRVDEARGGEGAHYGLGLSIAKAIVDAHGGSISAACRDGLVSFTVVLPR